MELLDRIIQFAREMRFVVAVVVLLTVLAVGTLAVLIVTGGKESEVKTVSAVARPDEPPFVLQNPLFPPAEASDIPDDYLLYRARRSEWTRQDLERWFTAPDSVMLDQLHAANERAINDLLRTAP